MDFVFIENLLLILFIGFVVSIIGNGLFNIDKKN